MVKTLLYCLLYASLNVGGAAWIKWILKGKKLVSISDWLGFLLHIPVMLAFMVIFLSAMVMFKALSGSNFSLVVPIATGANFVLTIIIGHFIFKDQITPITLLGLGFIITGIIILSLIPTQYAK